ncbi:alpha/beta-hydrolase [Pluteus cervinus]|uniref:Alpha/beta-hydrolase n=1 Tax=Pluteus cervinus TaxID=181527 RepID=A0ACD3AFN9_9AGAR|nr:alpha/beta-hydrolase [Pluteus cervinus]
MIPTNDDSEAFAFSQVLPPICSPFHPRLQLELSIHTIGRAEESATMESSIIRAFGSVTLGEKIQILVTALRLPFILIWSLATKPFVPHNTKKHWKRVLVDAAVQTLTCTLNRVQFQYMFGDPSQVIAEKWGKRVGVPIEVEEIGEDAKLIWIGQKRTDRVIFYLHGGGFLMPLQDSPLGFWNYVGKELKRRGQDVTVVALQYTLVPNAVFPTQLRQAFRALEHLLSSGVQPQNLQLAGDSAGANLIIQLLSHILHPLNDVPPIKLSAPIRGAYLMSPFTRLSGLPQSQNDSLDVISAGVLMAWGQDVLHGVPDSQNVYLEPANASQTWFAGVDKLVSRVLTTAGGSEALKDHIIEFNDLFAKHHNDTEFVIQEGGVHDDPFNDFILGEDSPILGDLTPIIIDWLFAGFDH